MTSKTNDSHNTDNTDNTDKTKDTKDTKNTKNWTLGISYTTFSLSLSAIAAPVNELYFHRVSRLKILAIPDVLDILGRLY